MVILQSQGLLIKDYITTGALLGCLNDVITTLDAGSGQIGEKDPARLNEINSTKKFPSVI